MTQPGFLMWFNRTALRVFLFNLREVTVALAACTSLRIGPHRELPIGFSLEASLWRHDGLAPYVGGELALGLVSMMAGVGSITGDDPPGGYDSKHLAKRGEPPFALYEGRFFWLKVARTW